jgi:hypothetical protein
MLVNLNKENAKALKQTKDVEIITENCITKKNEITEEERLANIELQAALPLLKEAEDAAKGIKPNDISELRSYQNPKDVQKYVFDMVLIVFQKGLDPVTMKSDVDINKQ